MNRSRQLAVGSISAALLAAIVLLTLFVVPAIAGPKKPYAAVISPSGVAAGSTPTFTATLTNETSTQQLGSANLSLPSGFVPLSVGTPSSGTATLVGSTVRLRNVSVAPGTSVSVSVSARVPCPLGTYTWSIIAKQANDFSGDPGNDLTLNQAHSSLTTNLTGTCHLGFAFTAQPANAQVATAMSTLTFDPSGPPVSVQVLDGNGDPIPTSTIPVTVSILSNAGGGTLAGTLTVNAIGGTASFPGISIDKAGLGYTLSAGTTVAAIDAGASGPFNIANVGKKCSAAACSSGTVTQGITSASEVASAGADGDLLSLYVAVEPLDCPGYQETSSVVTFDVSGSRTKSVTIILPKAGLKANDLRVCFASPNAFVDRSGATVNLGLLPDCSAAVAPCMYPAKVVKTTIVVTFDAPEGDPKGRV